MAGKYKNNIRKDKRGGYSYKITVAGVQYQGACKNCYSREKALAYVANLKAELRNKEKLSNDRVITIGVLGEKYKQYTLAKNGDIKHVRSKVKFFNEYFGITTPAVDIKRSDIDRLINYCRTVKNHKDTTIDRYISALSKMYNIAIDDEILLKNPCSKVKKLGLYNQQNFKFWNKNEILAIKKVSPLWLVDMIDCALITSLRRANIRLFNKDWVDWERNKIIVPCEHSKSRKAIELPMGKKLKEIIARNFDDNDTEYVFINKSRKTPRSEKTLENKLKESCALANVKYYGWNGFRHTAGTRMAQACVPIHEIQSYMAHSTPLVTRKYLDNSYTNKIAAMEILEGY